MPREVHIAPPQTEYFPTPQTGKNSQKHHRAVRLRKLREQRANLLRGERAPLAGIHQRRHLRALRRIPVEIPPALRCVEDFRQQVPKANDSLRSHLPRLLGDEHLHVRRSDLRQSHGAEERIQVTPDVPAVVSLSGVPQRRAHVWLPTLQDKSPERNEAFRFLLSLVDGRQPFRKPLLSLPLAQLGDHTEDYGALPTNAPAILRNHVLAVAALPHRISRAPLAETALLIPWSSHEVSFPRGPRCFCIGEDERRSGAVGSGIRLGLWKSHRKLWKSAAQQRILLLPPHGSANSACIGLTLFLPYAGPAIGAAPFSCRVGIPRGSAKL